jgi:hypothetical protein
VQLLNASHSLRRLIPKNIDISSLSLALTQISNFYIVFFLAGCYDSTMHSLDT